MSNGTIIGIDLGTGNSAISIMEGGKATVIPNAEGQYTTPSVVSFAKNGEVLVGLPAKRQAVVNARRTVNAIKRFMGRKWDEVQGELKNISYEMVNVNGLPRVRIDGKDYSPEQISAMILAKLKRDAEAYLGHEVKDAIITCPAYFDSAAKEATKNAGTIAGLNVLRIISEPTAACLSYGLGKKKSGIIGVVDIGCGTSDLSIIDVADGVFEVKATNGDNHLGGWDVDNEIAKWVIESFKADTGIDLSKDSMALQRINDEAEKAKIELSTTQQYDINLPFITADATGPKHLQMTLTRAKFETLVEPLFERLREPVRQCKADAGVDKIDEVILVGGTTRMPYVQKIVQEFYGIEPSRNANPDFVVAEGASIQGSILTGDTTDVLLLDTTPLNLGIETMGNVMTTLIEKNTTIPADRSQIFSTASDNQPGVEIKVYQGNRPMASDNKLLGVFHLDGIIPAPRGVPQIDVKFSIDANNILTVTAIDKATNKESHITIQSSSGMTKDEIERAKKEAELYAEADKKRIELVTARNELDAACFAAEKAIKDNRDRVQDEALVSEIETQIKEARKVMEEDDIKRIKDALEKLHENTMKFGAKVYEKLKKDNPEAAPGADFFNDILKNAGKANTATAEPPPQDDGPIDGGKV